MASKNKHIVHEGEALDDLMDGMTSTGKVVTFIIIVIVIIVLGVLWGVF